MSRIGQPSRTLYIANFPKDTQKQELQQLFSAYGKLVSLCILNKQKFSFAFADFETVEDARRVQQKLDQKTFGDMNMKVSFKEKKDNGHVSYQKPNQYSTPATHNGQFKSTSYGQKNSAGNTFSQRKPENKESRRSNSQSSRSRKNSVDREVPRERSRSKGYRRKGSSEQSSGRYQIKKRAKDIRGRSNSKDKYMEPRYTQLVSRQDSLKILNLERQILQLSKEVHYLTKRLSRVESQFEEFIDQYKSMEHKRR